MSVHFDLEENFLVTGTSISIIKPLIETWLRTNDFTLRNNAPPHMIMANSTYGYRGRTPKVDIFQLSFTEEEEIRVSAKMKGRVFHEKYRLWVHLVSLFKYLNSKLDSTNLSEILDYLLCDEYRQFHRDQGNILLE